MIEITHRERLRLIDEEIAAYEARIALTTEELSKLKRWLSTTQLRREIVIGKLIAANQEKMVWDDRVLV